MIIKVLSYPSYFKGPRVHCSWLTIMVRDHSKPRSIVWYDRHLLKDTPLYGREKKSVGTCVEGQLVHFLSVTRISITIQAGLPRQD